MAATATTAARGHWHAEGSRQKYGQAESSPKVEDLDNEEDEDDDGDDDEEEQRDGFFLPIQQHSRPATPAEVVFERDVLSLTGGKTESELNKHYTLAAQDLGLEEGRRSRQELGGDNGRRLSVYEPTLTTASSIRDSLSRASQSTPPTSCDSSEMQSQYARSYQQQAPSVMTNTRPLSSRPPSVLSSRSITSSIRNGFKRLSVLSRRTSTRGAELPVTESAPSIHNQSIAVSIRSHRPSTSQSTVVPQSPTSAHTPHAVSNLPAYHANVPSSLQPPNSPRSNRSRPLSRGQSLPSISTVASNERRQVKNFSSPFSPRSKCSETRTLNSYRPLSPTHEEGFSEDAQLAAAQARTARNRDLQRLRAGQLQEQRRFLTFQREQHGRLRIRHSDRVRTHKKLWGTKERELEETQMEKESEVEQRQLNAEFELVRTMEAEKKSVDARLRHMEGYVKGRGTMHDGSNSPIGTAISTVEDAASSDGGSFTTANDGVSGSDAGNRDSGLHLTANGSNKQQQQLQQQFPPRVINSHSMAMLGQQYRIKSQLPQLHAARIKVMREQQAKQLSKLQARHAVELNALQQDAEEAYEEVADQFREEEAELRKDFNSRRDRMEWRWKVAESMERRRLEEERCVQFAELRPVDWSANAWKGESA